MKKGSLAHVVVCVPSNGTWYSDFGKSLTLMFAYFVQHRVRKAGGQRLSLITAQGSMLSQNREGMVKTALQAGTTTHILFLDADMTFPPTLLNRLMEADKDIVGCNCTTRVSPIKPVAYDLKGNRIASIGVRGLEKVQHTGLAVMLINADVFRKMTPPIFLMDWIPDRQAYCGEDVYFAMKAQELGYDTWVDHDVSREIGHIGTRVCRHELIESMED